MFMISIDTFFFFFVFINKKDVETIHSHNLSNWSYNKLKDETNEHLNKVFSQFYEKASHLHDDDSFIKLLNEVWNNHCNNTVCFIYLNHLIYFGLILCFIVHDSLYIFDN